jgi:hypothetical protein
MVEILGVIATIVATLLSVGSACFWIIGQIVQKEIRKIAADHEFDYIKDYLIQLEKKIDEIKVDIQKIKLEGR